MNHEFQIFFHFFFVLDEGWNPEPFYAQNYDFSSSLNTNPPPPQPSSTSASLASNQQQQQQSSSSSRTNGYSSSGNQGSRIGSSGRGPPPPSSQQQEREWTSDGKPAIPEFDDEKWNDKLVGYIPYDYSKAQIPAMSTNMKKRFKHVIDEKRKIFDERNQLNDKIIEGKS